MVALCLAGSAGHAKFQYLAGLDAICTPRRLGGREGGQENQPIVVLPSGRLGDVSDRRKTDLGWFFGKIGIKKRLIAFL